MNKRYTTLIGVLVIALVAISCLTASADTVLSDNTTLSGGLGSFSLASVVTQDAGVYTYWYTLKYISGTATAHTFSVENRDDVSYSNADNSSSFTDPIYDPEAYAFEVKWINGNMNPGDTVVFQYSSTYSPMEDIRVFSYVVNSGAGASGEAIGMGTGVPEPGTAAGLAVGLLGIIPFIRKRRS